MNGEKLKELLRNRIFIGVGCFVIGVFIMTPFAVTTKQKEMLDTLPAMAQENETLKQEKTSLTDENAELKDKVAIAKPWFEMKEAEQKKLQEKEEAEKKAKEEAQKKAEAEKLAAEQAKRAEAEKAKKEAEAHKYETGLTYEALARNPKENAGKLVTFSGQIIQVVKGSTSTQYRMNVDSDYNQTILIEIASSKLTHGNILEDDTITIRGMFVGEQSYTTVLGATQTIPSVLVDEVDY